MSEREAILSRAEKSGNVRRYHAARAALIAYLGGVCTDCGTDAALQFDHIAVRVWVARDTARWVRIARYRREAEAGHVVLRCKRCNQLRGRPKRALRAKDD
jgi:hypothetical protein